MAAEEQKGPIDWLRRARQGVKAAKTAYSTTVAAEKLNEIKAAKRAAAVEKAKATREANKAARIKAAEEAAAAKPKRGRKPKATTAPETPTTKKRGTKPKPAEEKQKSSGGLKAFLIGAGATGIISQIGTKKGGQAEAKKVKDLKKSDATPTETSQPKGVVGNVLKSAGKYKFAKGGSMASKSGAAKYSKMTTKQTKSAASAVKSTGTRKPMMRPSIKKR
jgi:hypothetical protein